MVFKSFLLGNLVSLCMKIINSVVVVGLYYGFLTTFSIGPSYLFLLRAQVMEEGEEGIEKKISATTGFITGQLMMFISIYYAPLHLALGRPHTITVLALPYLLFHFFWNNHKHFFDYGSTTRNSMRNLSIQCVFLNNLIFQLFNHFILPSSMLARLVNIYMFRCNNKMLFVTSSFVGWLIGHILFMKWVGLVLVWIRQNHSIRSNVLIRKYLVSELRNSMARIFSILLFITCVYYLGRIPSPILTKKLKETSETEERDVEIETTSETKGAKQEQEGFTKEDPSSSLFSEEKEDPDKIDETEEIRVNGKEKTKDEFHFHFKETCYKDSPVYETSYLDGNQDNSKLEILKLEEDKDLFWFEKPIVTILFDYKRWNRPFRYIKNDQFEKAIRNEMSQYFFYPCQSDGKQRISFTYPLSLSTFFEMIQKKISLSTTEKVLTNELYNHWVFINEKTKNNLSKEFLNRIKGLDKRSHTLNILEKRTRLCNDKTKNEYLTKIYDPLINGPYRGTIKKTFSALQTSMENYLDTIWINKIHSILFVDSRKFEQKIYRFHRESSSKEIGHFLTLINQFSGESTSSFNFKNFYLFLEQGKIESENREKFLKILLNMVINDSNDQRIRTKAIPIGINEISKKVPRYSYKLIDDLEQQEGETEEDVPEDHQIRSRKFKRVVIFTDKQQNTADTNNPDQTDEVALIRYSQQSDFRRGIIKGSMRAQRRKTIIWEFFQANVHSPLFLDRIDKSIFLSFEISGLIKQIFINWMGKKKKAELKISDYTEKKTKEGKKREEDKKEGEEKARIEIAEAWDTILFAQVIRGSMLIIQSILRKYIILPSLIIAKNLGRILLFQFPEWSEDLKEWNRELHVKCTYNGVQLSEREFPKNWLTDGIQIKILFPFCLKPWHKSKPPTPHKDPMKPKREKDDFSFLTVWGMEAELPFGSPRKRPSFFEPIFKELKKKIRKSKEESFLVFKILKERTKLFRKFSSSKETKKWFIKSALFIKRKIKELSKINLISLFGLRKVYKSSETTKEKDSIINNQMIQEPSIAIQSMDSKNYSLTEKKIKDLTDKTSIIRNQIEKITKDKKKVYLTPERNINTKTKKKSYNVKILEPQKSIWQIIKRKNVRLIRKSYYFIQFFIERIYMDILLCIININIPTKLFLESTKKIIDKYIYNNERNPERIKKTKKKKIHFISIIKTLFTNLSDKNSKIFCDLSSLSQAYVFYKLVQTQLSNLYRLKPILLYNDNERAPFLKLKNEIKDYFVIQGIIYSELKQKKFRNCEMTQWKNWLTSHYQYDLSQIKLSKLTPQKCRNKINQPFIFIIFKNKDLNKCYLYEKDQLIYYEKENDYEEDLLPNIKDNFKKHYLYDLLSYKYIKYEGKKDSSIYRFPFQVNKKQGISYNYKNKTYKGKFFDMSGGIPINIGEDNIIEKTPDRKYFDWGILHFCFRKKVDIESWLNIDTLTKKNTNTKKRKKTGTDYYQIIEKIDKKFVFSFTIHQEINSSDKQKTIFDWMRMNEEILNRPISNLKLWFFPEFVLLYNTYKIKQWSIPIKLLLLNFNENTNTNVSENKNINGKQKENSFRSLNEKKSLELENINQEEKESTVHGDLRSDGQNQKNSESVLANQQKDIEEDYIGSDMKKRRKKKQYKSHTEAELDLFLKRYLLFQLRWDDSLNQKMINNIKVYCLLLRLRNPKEIAISSIQKEEMNLDIILIQKNLKFTELMQKGILIIEPIRLSIKNNGQFIMYQTIRIPLVHKNKHKTKTNQEYPQKKDVDKKNFDEYIERYQKMTENQDHNDFDLDLFVLENILSYRRRRELRIRIFFNLRNNKLIKK
nr:hypothetical chloroplast RF1 [Tetracera sarmentosa]USO20363.1 hypothetical chloroplast RF1 [Tetracera sarmentosa]